jgi:hypothetical protein
LKQVLILLVLISSCHVLFAQKQLVLLKRQDVVLRLYPGDEIILKLKNSKTVRTSYVNNIFEDAVVIHLDTIPFHKIDKIYFRQTKFYNTIGGILVVGGVGLFLIDQFNSIVVRGEDPRIDSWVTKVSVPAVVVGLPLMLLKKQSQRINHKYRLMMVQKGSSFYRPDSRGFDSEYIPNH